MDVISKGSRHDGTSVGSCGRLTAKSNVRAPRSLVHGLRQIHVHDSCCHSRNDKTTGNTSFQPTPKTPLLTFQRHQRTGQLREKLERLVTATPRPRRVRSRGDVGHRPRCHRVRVALDRILYSSAQDSARTHARRDQCHDRRWCPTGELALSGRHQQGVVAPDHRQPAAGRRVLRTDARRGPITTLRPARESSRSTRKQPCAERLANRTPSSRKGCRIRAARHTSSWWPTRWTSRRHGSHGDRPARPGRARPPAHPGGPHQPASSGRRWSRSSGSATRSPASLG